MYCTLSSRSPRGWTLTTPSTGCAPASRSTRSSCSVRAGAARPHARRQPPPRRRPPGLQPHAPQAATAGIQPATSCKYTARPQAGAEPSAALISHHLEQLRAGSKLSDRDMLAIFGDLLSFVSLGESKLVELLSMVPGSSPLGCLAPAACGRDVCLPGCNKPPGARQARPEEAQGSAGGGRARGHCLVAPAVFSSTPPRDVGHFAAQPPTAAALVDLRLQP